MQKKMMTIAAAGMLAFAAIVPWGVVVAADTAVQPVLAKPSVTLEKARAALAWTPVEHDARIAWWREARFGMLVHWGPSAYLGGVWRGKDGGTYSEHIQRSWRIPMSVYRTEVVEKFNPVKFDADEWVRIARDAGMGYFIAMAKHHDGFAMYDSKANDYNIIKATPFKRDPMKELRAAAKKYGIKFGCYYSHAFDWGDQNAPGNDWEWQNPGGDKLLHGTKWWLTYPQFLPRARKYVDTKSIPQVLELIRNYDPDILWFDTALKLPPEENLRILAAVRKANPRIVVNGRVLAHDPAFTWGLVDYQNTADRPAEFFPVEGDSEAIPTTNESYGYHQLDRSHKPPAHFIRLLAKAAARGGNLMLNMGPRGDGTVDPTDVAIFQGIGAWWKVNGESIRGTTRTPLPVQAWGESTRKGNRLYLHVFQWPRDGKLTVGGLKTDIARAYLLAAPDKPLTVTGSTIAVPARAPDATNTVIVLDFAGEPQASPVRLLVTNIEKDTLRSFDAKLSGKLGYGGGKTRDAWVNNWTDKDDAVAWPVRIDQTGTFTVAAVYDAPKGAKGAKVVEGDAGKERVRAHKGAGGTYIVKVGPRSFEKKVQQGDNVTDQLGTVTLAPGNYEIRVTAREITGEELLRLRSIILTPVTH